MTDLTPLDQAQILADQTGRDEDRLAFWNSLAEAELTLLLADEGGEDGTISPALFEVDGASYGLAFDLPERLTAFSGQTSATATLSGRQLARLLAAEGLGLGLNLDAAPSAQLLPPESIVWLSDTLARGPDEAERSIAEVTGPGALPESLLSALDGKLALTAGLAEVAYLAQVTYDDGTRSHVLVFIDPVPGAEADLARAMSEALIFSGVPAGQLDVLFLQANQAKSAVFARHGLRIDLPKPDVPVKPIETAPPKLR